ncbi:hypothetical protein [Edwardsiella anguillarum]|uniref:hypothetical protein n=1 Tax=Edwardsiella anguillarum TaxID=1821960 RepID=UPI000E355CE6|nr:hypothetical protein [Edwardsiella anguillarum]RFT04395.1 hypothetical protein CGL57_06265 [Edwardsiella anguillarum]
MRWLGLFVPLLAVSACSSTPGHFVRSEEDPVSHSLVYRFDPEVVDRAAMQADALAYCRRYGFDRAHEVGTLKPGATGLTRAAFLCVYQPVRAPETTQK